MAEKPKLIDIVSVMGDDTKRFLVGSGKCIFNFMKGIGGFYIAPSLFRRELNKTHPLEKIEDGLTILGVSCSTVINFSVSSAYYAGRSNECFDPDIGIKAVVLAPIATNAASGLYEWYRSASNRAAKNAISEKFNRGGHLA